jgi:hypothetical protein
METVRSSFSGAVWFYIDGDNLNGAFDAIEFKTWTYPQNKFGNNNSGNAAGIPRGAGQQFTYPNRMLNADPLDFPGALGLTMSGLVNTTRELSFKATSPTGAISTASEPNGDLFLGNFYIPNNTFAPGSFYLWRIRLLSAGTTVYDTMPGYWPLGPLTGTWAPPASAIPEPAAIATFSFGAIVLSGIVCLRQPARTIPLGSSRPAMLQSRPK